MRRTKAIALLMAVILLLSFVLLSLVSCGGDDENTLVLYGWGDQDSLPVFNRIIENFNNTVGAENNIKVKFSAENVNYETLIEQSLSGKRGPDLFFVKDQYFKKWTKLGFLAPLDNYLDGVDLDGMWDTAVSRYRYNVENNTSTDTATLWGLPLGNSPTVLFYNKTALEAAGVIVTSVPLEEITQEYVDAFNTQHGTSLSVQDLSRGFYRENPYVNGSLAWTRPTGSEVMVFNNQIAMSWDEIEDLAGIMTKSASYNPASPTTYGYYTEWWFNYAFSVGGDCIEDTTGNGDYTFTLGDTNSNFLVLADTTVNGNAYTSGSFVSYNDKNYLASAAGAAERATLTEGGYLSVLPSTYEAFARFVNLSQTEARGGIQVSPTTTTVTGSGQQKTGFFANKQVAMLVDYSYNTAAIRRLVGDTFEWDIAPLPVYKTYDDEGNVAAHGLERGHSSSSCIAISDKCTKKDKAALFIRYISGEAGQTVIAESGFDIPNQVSLFSRYASPVTTPKNNALFASAAAVQTPGDWWYMPDKVWIDEWAVALNQNVRNNGNMTLVQFITEYTPIANRALDKYKSKP